MPSRPPLFVAAACAIGMSACGSPSTDDTVIVRAGDAVLTEADLRTLLTDAGELVPEGSARVPGNKAREQVTDWVREQLVERGGIVARYEESPGEHLGVACFYASPIFDRAAADDMLARLDGGETWDQVIVDFGPQFVEQSRQACASVAEWAQQVGDDVARQFGELTPAGGPRIVESPDGTVAIVVRAHTLDELDRLELFNATLSSDPKLIVDEALAFDVEVDPRYGAFEPDIVAVVPLG